ncbi:predicted protein [Arabidopsis lyrata subsp. lyrata]|uniref:Predicted protein n=1 Tax=Arabidopsis lyrata subsp. lyrata TaxID=81972 RepID=D7L1R9_ARALL|nr:predicted protein [Arabidopsis lyrata subsp. lyrata]
MTNDTLVYRSPCSYSMKIQSLSQLKKLFPKSAYKSLTISSGKYNWRLVIYPKDVEGNQFNALRPVWGFSQVIPLDTFNDPENGYVFDGDQCEFGIHFQLREFVDRPREFGIQWFLIKRDNFPIGMWNHHINTS